MTEVRRVCIRTKLPTVEIASCEKESPANLSRDREGGQLLSGHRGLRGYRLLVMISESEENKEITTP